MTSNARPRRPRLLTVPQVAEELHVSVGTVWRRLATGDLSRFKDGNLTRVPADSVEEYIRRHINI